MTRDLSKDLLGRISKAMQKEEKGVLLYGSRLSPKEVLDLVGSYCIERLLIKNFYDYVSGSGSAQVIDYKGLLKNHDMEFEKMLNDTAIEEYLQIRSIICKFITCQNNRDIYKFANAILAFGNNVQWPGWISSSQVAMTDQFINQINFNSEEDFDQYKNLMFSKNLSVSVRSLLANKLWKFAKAIDIKDTVLLALSDKATQLQILNTIKKTNPHSYSREIESAAVFSTDDLFIREANKLLKRTDYNNIR